MAKSRAKKYKTIANPELVRALSGFRAVFGNHDDRTIADRHSSYQKLLETVDNDVLRGPKKNLTTKMKQVLFEEEALIHFITQRNFDF